MSETESSELSVYSEHFDFDSPKHKYSTFWSGP